MTDNVMDFTAYKAKAVGGPTGTGASGFQNLDTTFKYRFYKDPVHELIMSVGLSIEWGGSGASGVGADKFTTYTPTFFFGKGFGDLPDTVWWARPIALTGTVGYSIPGSAQTATFDPDTGNTDIELHPQFLKWGLSLQYSMPYLKSAVYDFALPDFVNRLIPIVEAQFQTPAANFAGLELKTTGTINPGVIYVSNYYQIGLEAIIPINRDSGHNVGALAQLHVYLDDLFPTTIGKPIFGGPVAPARPEGLTMRFITIALLLLFLRLDVGAAHAHAFLDHADPRVGNTVKSSPRAVSLWFTQNLESSFSTAEVLDSTGAQMNAGKASVDANDRKLLRVPVKVLPPESYMVKWHVLSVDTHTTEGNFTFHVGP
jgi:methionine-rich copper-binding protein CopC